MDEATIFRFLALDDPAQSARAVQIVQELSEDQPGFVTAVVLAETVWVLDRHYRQDRTAIADIIQGLLSSDVLTLEHAARGAAALSAMRDAGAEFTDALIGAIAAGAGCSHTLTFDRRAARLPGFQHA